MFGNTRETLLHLQGLLQTTGARSGLYLPAARAVVLFYVVVVSRDCFVSCDVVRYIDRVVWSIERECGVVCIWSGVV